MHVPKAPTVQNIIEKRGEMSHHTMPTVAMNTKLTVIDVKKVILRISFAILSIRTSVAPLSRSRFKLRLCSFLSCLCFFEFSCESLDAFIVCLIFLGRSPSIMLSVDVAVLRLFDLDVQPAL